MRCVSNAHGEFPDPWAWCLIWQCITVK